MPLRRGVDNGRPGRGATHRPAVRRTQPLPVDSNAELFAFGGASVAAGRGRVPLRRTAVLRHATTFREHIKDLLGVEGQPDDTDGQPRRVVLRWLVLDSEDITDIDVTGSHAIAQTLTSCRNRGVTVALLRVRQDLLATLTHQGLLERVEIYDSNQAGVAAADTRP